LFPRRVPLKGCDILRKGKRDVLRTKNKPKLFWLLISYLKVYRKFKYNLYLGENVFLQVKKEEGLGYTLFGCAKRGHYPRSRGGQDRYKEQPVEWNGDIVRDEALNIQQRDTTLISYWGRYINMISIGTGEKQEIEYQ